jgi:hypothetical protein
MGPAASATEAVLSTFAHVGGTRARLRVRVGESTALSMVAHNVGGASLGVTVVIWGPALDRGLLDPKEVLLIVGSPLHGSKLTSQLQLAQADLGPIRVANFPNAALRSGPTSPQTAFRPGVDFDTGWEAWLNTRVELSLATPALRLGSGEIHLGLVPAGNPEGGQASLTIRVDVNA